MEVLTKSERVEQRATTRELLRTLVQGKKSLSFEETTDISQCLRILLYYIAKEEDDEQRK